MNAMLKPGSRRCQCPTCGEYFNSVTAFDRHRVGDFDTARRCLTVAEMEAVGFMRNAARFWITDSRTQQATRRAAAALLEDFADKAGGSTVPPLCTAELPPAQGAMA